MSKKTRTERNTRPPATTTEAPTTLAETTTTTPTAPSETRAPEARVPEAPAPKGTVQVVTRFPAELAALVDAYVERMRGERLGLRVSRADAVRILVHERLAELDVVKWPHRVQHDGKTFFRTGKRGTDRASGLPSTEYESENGERVWRNAEGVVRAE